MGDEDTDYTKILHFNALFRKYKGSVYFMTYLCIRQ